MLCIGDICAIDMLENAEDFTGRDKKRGNDETHAIKKIQKDAILQIKERKRFQIGHV